MAQTPAAGAKAPDFSLVGDDGRKVSLKDFRGKKLVLYFYPKADTAILGVSADPVKAQDAFKRKHKLAIPLASDESHKMLTDYGVWGEKSMYGRTFMGITRATFLIGTDGRIAQVWPKVKVDGHAEAVLAAAKAL
jgi:thioredoxin-dependent peroxiredoxin